MEKISIAKVIKPKGLKGELKCMSLTENHDLFSGLNFVYCNNEKINVISSVFRLGYVYITLENINTVEKAEQLRGKELFIDKENYGELGESTYFIEDLIDLPVFDENNQHIGEVLSVQNYGASDILEVKDKWATFLVPFIKEVFVDVDINAKKITVNRKKYEEYKLWK